MVRYRITFFKSRVCCRTSIRYGLRGLGKANDDLIPKINNRRHAGRVRMEERSSDILTLIEFASALSNCCASCWQNAKALVECRGQASGVANLLLYYKYLNMCEIRMELHVMIVNFVVKDNVLNYCYYYDYYCCRCCYCCFSYYYFCHCYVYYCYGCCY